MRTFHLNRLEDETGVSGTGIIAEGYIYPNGICVMRWLTDTSSVATYRCIEDVEHIHGHGGKTQVIIDSETAPWENLPLWVLDPIDYFDEMIRNT